MKNYRIFLIFMAFTGLGANLFAAPSVNKNPLEIVHVDAEHLQNTDFKKAIITLDLSLAKAHKAYDSAFKVTPIDSNIEASSPEVSPLSYHKDKFSKNKEKLMFLGKGILRATLSSKTQLTKSVKLNLVYQACTETYCLLPQKKVFTVTFPPLPSKSASSKKKSFLNFDLSKKSPWTIFLIYLFGFLTAFSPCVFPMIPITMGFLGFSDTSNRAKGFIIGLFYSLGLALTYALVGLAVAKTGGFIGQAFSNPYIVWGIFFFYIFTAIAMMGFISIKTPFFIDSFFSKIKGKGVWGAFLAGAVGGIIASPCVGPAIAAILAYVAQAGDPLYGFISLFAYGMGLGSLFILIGVFYGELNSRLKPGPWLNWIKYILAGLIIFGALLFIKPHLSFFKDSHSHRDEKTLKNSLWKPFTLKSYEAAINQKKFILIDFYADWCAACKELDEDTFSHPNFKKETSGLVLLKFDATKPTKKEQDVLSKFEVFGLPTILFINAKGKVQNDLTLTGFEKWPDFQERLQELKKN